MNDNPTMTACNGYAEISNHSAGACGFERQCEIYFVDQSVRNFLERLIGFILFVKLEIEWAEREISGKWGKPLIWRNVSIEVWVKEMAALRQQSLPKENEGLGGIVTVLSAREGSGRSSFDPWKLAFIVDRS